LMPNNAIYKPDYLSGDHKRTDGQMRFFLMPIILLVISQ